MRHRPWQIRVAVAFRDPALVTRFERYLKSGSGRAFAQRHFDGAREEILFIVAALFTEWRRPPRFRDRNAVFGGADIGDSGSARRRGDSHVFRGK